MSTHKKAASELRELRSTSMLEDFKHHRCKRRLALQIGKLELQLAPRRSKRVKYSREEASALIESMTSVRSDESAEQAVQEEGRSVSASTKLADADLPPAAGEDGLSIVDTFATRHTTTQCPCGAGEPGCTHACKRDCKRDCKRWAERSRSKAERV